MLKKLVLIGSGIFALITVATSVSRYINEHKKTKCMQKRLENVETEHAIKTVKAMLEEARKEDDFIANTRRDVERINRQVMRSIGE